MKTVNLTIEGVSPLLINRFKEQDEIPVTTKKGKKDYGTPREQASQTPYFDARTGKLWVPSSWVTGTIRSIASDYKLPGTRKSVKSVSGGAIFPTEEKLYFKEGYKVKDIEVDSRPVVVQRARIMRHRAKLENWTVSCGLEIDEEIIPTDDVHQILSDAGRRAGMGDFRPQRGGPFGRFKITKWKTQADKKKRGRPAAKKTKKKA
jgi:hypothetical protein